MTPQERDVIAGIFDRLRQAANQPRDPEAENFIAERLREQPYAPYAMAQAVYVQEQALANLNQQVESLQAQLREAQNRASEAAQPQAGGFLSGIFGGGSVPRTGTVPPVPPRTDAAAPSGAWNTQAQSAPGQPMQAQGQPGPWSNQPQQQARGGGFMASALTTAAGVAGGMMLGNVLTNAFGGGSKPAAQTASDTGANSSATPAAPQQAAADQSASAQPAADQTAQDSGYSQGYDGEASYQNASYDDAGAGFDDGGADDDSWV
ncbi:DUF2076 domain-containing protein [Bosea beijingensis]|uniref:DUF2076 domain-containing protein n=1 Tax=Bosea beijingensis TaxID=3068632 RepID=UPI0027404978|nr:DUF2076 domain-containing protein [Bosea sp. REN20]